MKTVKISALVLAMAGVFATSANAQSAKKNAWEGAYGQVGVGFGIFTPNIGNGNAAYPGRYSGVPVTTSASNVNNVNTGLANIALGYNFGINESYVLGIAATYYPGASSSATGNLNLNAPAPYNAQYPAGLSKANIPASYNVKNLFSVVLTPGYVIDKDRLAYAKVGYTGATVGLNGQDVPYTSVNLTGYTLGLGYKQMVTSSIFAFGELNYAGYSNKTASLTTANGIAISNVSVKGSGTDFLVGVGYRF